MRYPFFETIGTRFTPESKRVGPAIDFSDDLRREFPGAQGNHFGMIPLNL
jgi:hypothetical protein